MTPCPILIRPDDLPAPMRLPPGTPYHSRVSSGDGWACERKYNGIRALLWRGGWLGRDGKLPQNSPDVSWLPPGLVVDCELVDGAVIAFDLLMSDGEDLRRLPYAERRLSLRQACAWHARRLDIARDDVTWEQAISDGWEGVVYKSRSSEYPRGKTPLWLKTKQRYGG